VTKQPAMNQPFWLSAAWALEFMGTKLRAPSQASFWPDEVALAKWLSRWTTDAAIEKLRRCQGRAEIAIDLDRLVQGLRSRRQAIVTGTKTGLADWLNGDLYARIAKVAELDAEWMTEDRRLEFNRKLQAGRRFWPSWRDWKRETAV